MCDLRTIVPKNVFLLRRKERVFNQKIIIIIVMEQTGPLVLKWNHLFRVPNSERNNLVLYARFGNYCS